MQWSDREGCLSQDLVENDVGQGGFDVSFPHVFFLQVEMNNKSQISAQLSTVSAIKKYRHKLQSKSVQL